MEPFWFFTGVVVVLDRLNTAPEEVSATEPETAAGVSRGLVSPV